MGAPVILCGATEQIGRGVIATLKPEYDGSWNTTSQVPPAHLAPLTRPLYT